jgi:hypothetical protein
MAACGARAAAIETPDHWVSRLATPSSWGPWITVFVQRLRELGWIENRNVAIEVRWAEGHGERYAEIAAEFVGLKADVIVTTGVVPENSIRRDSRGEAESAHHPIRCLPSFTCLQRL